MGVVADRLKEAMADRLVDQAALASAVGITQGAVSLIVRGETQRSRYLPAIAEYLGVSLAWLSGGDEPKHPSRELAPTSQAAAEQLDSVLVPLYNGDFSMGGGTFFDEAASHEMIPFARSWLRGKIAGRFDQLVLLPGRGDSMATTINDGDVMLCDRAQTEVKEADMIWAFGYGDTGMIKRLRRLPKGGYLVQSDNPVVREFKATDNEVTIVGRIVTIMRWQ